MYLWAESLLTSVDRPADTCSDAAASQAQRVDLLVSQGWSSDRAACFAGRAGKLTEEVEREARWLHETAKAEAVRFRREAFLKEERQRASRQGGMLLTFRPPPSRGLDMLVPPETGALSSWCHEQPKARVR